jgi:hypothetical protein
MILGVVKVFEHWDANRSKDGNEESETEEPEEGRG